MPRRRAPTARWRGDGAREPVGEQHHGRQGGLPPTLCAAQSALPRGLPLFAAGPGESTTDLAWDGQALIYENGDLLAESERFREDAA